MLFIEMTQDPVHGGGEIWGFSKCLWSPTEKDGGGRWGYWEVINEIRGGDTIIHLQNYKAGEAQLVGISIADSQSYVTRKRPPRPGKWGFAEKFYRLPLRDFQRLDRPIKVRALFQNKANELSEYFAANSLQRGKNRRKLFYVPQAGKLQCQNGAYLSEVDKNLASIIFELNVDRRPNPNITSQVTTGETRSLVNTRVGQEEFSNNVRANFGFKCCFPGCEVDHETFLVGSHIVRWADNHELRGNVQNGLCLCLFHDRAFEMGFFTLTKEHKVLCNKAKCKSKEWLANLLLPYEGREIVKGEMMPASEAIEAHWERIQIRIDEQK